MSKKFKIVAVVAAIIAFVFCFVGGVWILSQCSFSKDDALPAGIGLYFIGKAFFVGPMLLVVIHKG